VHSRRSPTAAAVDAIAPGVEVPSCYVHLSVAEEDDRLEGHVREYGYARWSGTSFAAPRVAGTLATKLHAGLPLEQARAEVLAAFAR
jgi:subtilisin family serine protease